MKRIFILAVMLGALSACQTIPVERTNNCTCNWKGTDGWEPIGSIEKGALA